MSSYELKNKEGTQYRLSHGAGPGVLHDDNLARSEFHAERLLANVPDVQLYDAFGYFYFTRLQRLELSGNPRTALAQAIGNSHLVLEQLAASSAGPLGFVDKRFMLRNGIRQQLNAWVAQEQMQKRIRQQVYAESTPIEKMLIPVGAFFQGVFNFGNTVVENVWGLGCWLKDVHDVANPFLAQYREFQAFGMAREKLGDNASFSSVLAEQQKQAQILHKKELIEALGFDPSQLSAEQFAEALDIACIVCTDPILWGIFSDFAIDYLKAQHFTELTEVGVAGVLEMILLAIIIWVTLGVGVTAAVASQTRHLPKLKKIGQLLAEFADATKAFNKHVKERAAKIDGDNAMPAFTDMDTVDASVNKVRVDDANTGSITKKKKKETDFSGRRGVPPTSLDDAADRLTSMRKDIIENGHQDKYTDKELMGLAESGSVPNEQYQVRFMPKKFLQDRNSPDVPLSGKMGGPFNGKSGEGVKYWSTSFDQLEDADSDPKLISEKIGIEYTPDDYVIVVVDNNKASQLSGAKSITPTYNELGKFATDELPDKYSTADTDKLYTPEFQEQYNALYKSAQEQGINVWKSEDLAEYNEVIAESGMSPSDFKKRLSLHGDLGSNEDFLGNGVTKNMIDSSPNDYGVVETFTFEASPKTLAELEAEGAIKIIDNVKPI